MSCILKPVSIGPVGLRFPPARADLLLAPDITTNSLYECSSSSAIGLSCELY